MKLTTTLLLLVAFAGTSFSQAMTNSCAIIINGQEIKPGSTITKEQVTQLCTLQERFEKNGKLLQPNFMEWVVSTSGMIYKGNLTNCNKLTEIAPKLKTGDIIFIENIKYRDVVGLCNGQLALKVE